MMMSEQGYLWYWEHQRQLALMWQQYGWIPPQTLMQFGLPVATPGTQVYGGPQQALDPQSMYYPGQQQAYYPQQVYAGPQGTGLPQAYGPQSFSGNHPAIATNEPYYTGQTWYNNGAVGMSHADAGSLPHGSSNTHTPQRITYTTSSRTPGHNMHGMRQSPAQPPVAGKTPSPAGLQTQQPQTDPIGTGQMYENDGTSDEQDKTCSPGSQRQSNSPSGNTTPKPPVQTPLKDNTKPAGKGDTNEGAKLIRASSEKTFRATPADWAEYNEAMGGEGGHGAPIKCAEAAMSTKPKEKTGPGSLRWAVDRMEEREREKMKKHWWEVRRQMTEGERSKSE